MRRAQLTDSRAVLSANLMRKTDLKAANKQTNTAKVCLPTGASGAARSYHSYHHQLCCHLHPLRPQPSSPSAPGLDLCHCGTGAGDMAALQSYVGIWKV